CPRGSCMTSSTAAPKNSTCPSIAVRFWSTSVAHSGLVCSPKTGPAELTVSDICRKVGIAETTYYRWRQQYDPEKVDADRRCRELELEVDRLKRLVAELLLDKQMLQDIAKKNGEPRPAAGRR